MVVVDGQGIPLGNLLESASPAEVKLVEPTLETIAVPRGGRSCPRKRPARLIYDKACDADPLRKRLARRGIDLICPHHKNRKQPPRQDGRKLRRYKRRWKVERTFAWLLNARRHSRDYERLTANSTAMIQISMIRLLLNRLT